MLMDFSNSPEKKIEPEKVCANWTKEKSTLSDKKVEKDLLDDDYEGQVGAGAGAWNRNGVRDQDLTKVRYFRQIHVQ